MTILNIITNESVSKKDEKYSCDNIDLKSIPESLSQYTQVKLIGRKSKIQRNKEIHIDNFSIHGNIFSYLFAIIKKKEKQKDKYLIISISPYTFLACIVLSIFKVKPYVYLRSDGYKEYKSILGFYGPFLYHVMFSLVAKFSFLISCREHILKKKEGIVVSPSQLNDNWFSNQKKLAFDKIKLLYVGRIRIEKGIFSLAKILQETDYNLTVVTSSLTKNINKFSKNIKVIDLKNNNDEIIKIYDEHNIFILPSFTEGHPQVLDEALARWRPVIVFNEISHVVRERKGVFVTERNIESLKETINHISSNFEKIQEDIKKNSLPTKKSFIQELKTIMF